MYKLLIFLKKSDDEKINSHFEEYTLKYLKELSAGEIKVGEVESNLLLDVKYSKYCEVEADSKSSFDELMNSKTGKLLSKDLMDFHQNLTVIPILIDNEK